MNLASCLFQWLKTFQLEGKFENLTDLCDGVCIAHVLVKIAPEYFTSSFISKIEKECGASWFLRLSNLRRIYLCLVDYYGEVLDRHIPDKLQPDLEVIARDYDIIHLGKLLQLILGCAINCTNKEKHIEVMTTLSLEVKQALKIAIDELENFDENSNVNDSNSCQMSSNLNSNLKFSAEEFNKLQDELLATKNSKEILLQKCSEIESVLIKLKEEKNLLKLENEKLNEKCNLSKNVSLLDLNPKFDSLEHETYFQRLNNQINALQLELTKMEEQKEDYRINLEIKEKEYHKLLLQVEQLQTKLNDFKKDRDELDQLKYLNEEIIRYKNINEVQKKKLEEFQELKKQVKIFEDRNSALIKQTFELEEENKSIAVYKNQLDLMKKQRDDLRAKVSEESFRGDKAENELKRIFQKYNEILQDKEKMQFEFERLKVESTMQKRDHVQMPSIDADLTASMAANNISSVFTSDLCKNDSNLNEKVIRLEYENEKLREALMKSNDEKAKLLESQLEDEKSRVIKLESESRANNQKILELEGQIKDFQTSVASPVKKYNEDASLKLKGIQLENANLKSLIEKKNEELAEKEERFKKYVNKAKETFGILETHINNPKVSSSLPDGSKNSDDICYWRNLAHQKETELEKIKNDFEKNNAFRDIEERLMAISFHTMSFNLQRKAAEDRMYSNNFTPNSTFLSRQRQASSRKFIISPSDVVE